MSEKTLPVRDTPSPPSFDPRSIQGAVGWTMQLVAMILMIAMLATVFHKLYADSTAFTEQFPDDPSKAVIQGFLLNMTKGQAATPWICRGCPE